MEQHSQQIPPAPSLQRGELTVQGYPIRRGLGGVPINRTTEAGQYLYAWRNQHAEAPDYWLRVIVAEVFVKLLMANTQGRPAAEYVAGAAELMVDVVGEGMTEALDSERVKQGFKLLFRTFNKWPTPADVLKVLPSRRVTSPQTSRTGQTSLKAFDSIAGGEALQDILDLLEKKEREDRHGA
jgi:hypothetical protein